MHKTLPSPSGYVPATPARTAHEHPGQELLGAHARHEGLLAGHGKGGEDKTSVLRFSDTELRGKQYILIEYCCSANSTIGAAAPAYALVVQVSEDLDAGSTSVRDALLKIIQQARDLAIPIAIWSSTPCTGGSAIQNLNISRFGVTEKLRGHWTEFHRLCDSFQPLASAISKAGGLIAIEWPTRCTYWRDGRVVRLLRQQAPHSATLASCAY